jgi:hypothetical protein
MKLTVVLGASGEASFDITLNDNPFVYKWVEELRWCLDNCAFNQQEAFSGLLTLTEARQILNNACVTINKYLKNYIDIQPEENSQEYFNYLHSKFEQLNGKFGKPTRLFVVANQELKSAIRNLNFFVHRVESKAPIKHNFYLSFDKNHYRRHPLQESDYQYFEFKISPGTLFLHYVELGKEFIDLYEDGLDLSYSGFSNLHYYSGEASIIFKEWDCFRDKNYLTWLTNNGIDPYNKKLGHGRIPLGIVADIDVAIDTINKFKHINTILIKE